MHDVFIVTSEGLGGGHIARIVYACDEADARQAVQDSYPGELVRGRGRPIQQGELIKKASPPIAAGIKEHGRVAPAIEGAWGHSTRPDHRQVTDADIVLVHSSSSRLSSRAKD